MVGFGDVWSVLLLLLLLLFLLVSLVVVLLVSVYLIFLFQWKTIRRLTQKNDEHELGNTPLGNMGWCPFLGETLSFLTPHHSYSLGTYLHDHCTRYGKVFKSHLFGCPTIVSCDKELNSFILQNEEKLFQCSYPTQIHGILGKFSMLVVVGDVHKRLRTLALNFINMSKTKTDYLENIEMNVIRIMDSWRGRRELIFCDEARSFTFNVIVKQILSLSPNEPETAMILDDFLTFMKGLVSFPLYIPGTPYAKAVKARLRISATVGSMVKKRKLVEESAAMATIDDERRSGGDFLDVLVRNHSSCLMSDEERVSLILDLLLGGYETTSLLMAMAVYFLTQSPPALQQLKVEHCAISGRKKEGEFLTWEDYRQMEFTQHVINEALRCGNIVKFVHRKAVSDVRFKGYLIPSGWKVLPVFSAVHLDPLLHDNPHEFWPWRWEGVHASGMSKKFAPFGGGLRLCPGAELARVEVAFFLHHLILNFRWARIGTDSPLAYPYVEFERGLRLKIEPV